MDGFALLHELDATEASARELHREWQESDRRARDAADDAGRLAAQCQEVTSRAQRHRERLAVLLELGLRAEAEATAAAAIAEQAVIDSFVEEASSASPAPIEPPPADSRVTGFSCPNCGNWRPLSDLAEDGVCCTCRDASPAPGTTELVAVCNCPGDYAQFFGDERHNDWCPASAKNKAKARRAAVAAAVELPTQRTPELPAFVSDDAGGSPRETEEAATSVDSWADEACVGEHLPGRAVVAVIRPPSRDELAQRATDHVAAAGVLGYSELIGYLTASMTELSDDDARRRAVDAVHIARRRGVLWYDDDGRDVSSRSAMLDAQLIRLMRAQASGIPQAVLLKDTCRQLATLTPPIVVGLSEAGTALERLVAAGRLAQRGLTVSAPKPRVATLSDEQRDGLRTMLRGGRSINSIAKATGLTWAVVNEFALAEGFKRG